MGDLVMFQQMGFGVAVALLIDATIIRSVLLPAAMGCSARWNWYLPRWLEWLPRIEVEARAAGGRRGPERRFLRREVSLVSSLARRRVRVQIQAPVIAAHGMTGRKLEVALLQ